MLSTRPPKKDRLCAHPQTLALANSIANAVTEPMARLFMSKAKDRVALEYQKWIELVLSLVMKGVVIVVSTKIHNILGAVQSAIRGELTAVK